MEDSLQIEYKHIIASNLKGFWSLAKTWETSAGMKINVIGVFISGKKINIWEIDSIGKLDDSLLGWTKGGYDTWYTDHLIISKRIVGISSLITRTCAWIEIYGSDATRCRYLVGNGKDQIVYIPKDGSPPILTPYADSPSCGDNCKI